MIDGVAAIALWDSYLLNPGHVLLVPRRHVASWFDATGAERDDMLRLADDARRIVTERHSPDGFNLGINDGAAAGRRCRTSTCTSSRAIAATYPTRAEALVAPADRGQTMRCLVGILWTSEAVRPWRAQAPRFGSE